MSASLVGVLADVLEALRDVDTTTAVVLTAHSLPKRVFDSEPEYIAQLHETADLVASVSGLSRDRWSWAPTSPATPRPSATT